MWQVSRRAPRELAAFADAIQHGAPHRNSPAEGLRDLAVVEALLAAQPVWRCVCSQPNRLQAAHLIKDRL